MTSFSSGVIQGGASDATTSNVDFYVATTGDDANEGSASSPFASIPGALAKLKAGHGKFSIKHTVTLNVGAGTFAPFVASGFSTLPADVYGTNYSWLHIKGTMQDCVPASTGSASGTLSAFSALSASTFAVATDASNNMTVNEYEGCYLEILTGTGSTSTVAFPARHHIKSNTATAFTVQGTSLTNPAAGSTYKVVKPATFISAGTTPAISTASPMSLATPTNTSFGAAFVQNEGTGYAISNIEFTLSASMLKGIVMQETRLRAFHCRFIATGGSSPTAIQVATNTHSSSGLVAYGLYCNLTAGTNGRFYINQTLGGAGSAPGPSFTSCMVRGGIEAITLGGCANGAVINNCMFQSQTIASLNLFGCGVGQFLNSRIDGSATGVSVVESNSSGLGNTTFALNACDISNCTVAGVTLQSAFAGGYLQSVTGSGNLVGLKMSRGAVCVVASSTTLTGATECTLDGTSAPFATMRGATPKVTKNADYLTRIYE